MTETPIIKGHVYPMITAWFCCKCHAYNHAFVVTFAIDPNSIPDKADRPCVDCQNVTRVKVIKKESFEWDDEHKI